MYYSTDMDITKEGYTPISVTLTCTGYCVGNVVPVFTLYDNSGVVRTDKDYLEFTADTSQTVWLSYRIIYIKNNYTQYIN